MANETNYILIAEAIKTMVNSASIPGAATAEIVFYPKFKVTDLATQHISIVPRTEHHTILTRGIDEKLYAVDISLQKKVDDTLPATIDPLVKIAGAIKAAVSRKRLTGLDKALVRQVNHDPILSEEHMDQHQVFTSIVKLEVWVAE